MKDNWMVEHCITDYPPVMGVQIEHDSGHTFWVDLQMIAQERGDAGEVIESYLYDQYPQRSFEGDDAPCDDWEAVAYHLPWPEFTPHDALDEVESMLWWWLDASVRGRQEFHALVTFFGVPPFYAWEKLTLDIGNGPGSSIAEVRRIMEEADEGAVWNALSEAGHAFVCGHRDMAGHP